MVSDFIYHGLTMIPFSANILSDLERMILDLRGQISREALQENVLTRIRIAALSDMERRLQQIRYLTSKQKVKLAFIGPVGIGKTTILCDLLGLHIKDKDAKSGEDVFRKVLMTASGRTTACEVKILIRDEVRIDVLYPPLEEMYTTLEDFGWSVWKDAQKPLPENMDFPESEVLKVMRNLLHLKGDAGTKLAQEYAEFEGFYLELLKRYEAEDRSQTELIYSGSQAQALLWVAEHFKQLNLGTLPGFSLPRSIQISLPRKLLHIPDDFQLDCVIDTKGLEHAGAVREDIDDYIRQGDYLCLFVDRFNSAPDSVLPLLQRLLTSDAVDREQRCALIVNTQENEVASTLDDDGDTVSEEEALLIKAGHVRAAFAGAKVNQFLDSNVYFHDPHSHFEAKGDKLRLKRGSSETAIRENPGRLWSWIGDLLIRQDAHFHGQVEELKKRLRAFEEGGVLETADLACLQLTFNSIRGLTENPIPSTGSQEGFIRSLRTNYHVSTFRAINNRRGIYNGNDIYYQAGELSEQYFRNITSKGKENIERAMHDLRAQVHNEALKEALVQYLSKLNADYQAAANTVRAETRETVAIMISPFYALNAADELLWNKVIERWGQGPGYTDDVLSYYKAALKGLESKNAAIHRQAWHSTTTPLKENLRTT